MGTQAKATYDISCYGDIVTCACDQCPSASGYTCPGTPASQCLNIGCTCQPKAGGGGECTWSGAKWNSCGPVGPVCGNGTCESGESTATCPGDCPAGGPGPGPGPGSCDGCSDAGSCSGKGGSYSGSSASNHPECAAQGGYCSGTTNCGGPPSGTPPPGNLSCGQSCTSSSQCRNPSPANVPTACINGTCQSTMCPVGMTIPGANCSCGANTRKCGQTCNASIGLCGPGQGFCTHINPPGNWYDGLPDCLDNNTYCAGSRNGFSQPKCNYTDTGNSYLNKDNAVGTNSWKLNIIPDDVIMSCQLCGNGTIEAPEVCDAGTNNGTSASTCTTSCQPVSLTLTVNTKSDFIDVNSGDPVTLVWTSAGMVNLVASGDWTGSKNVSGTQVIPNITTPKQFTLTGTQTSTGLPITVSVNVNIIGQTAAPQITMGVYVDPKFESTYGHWLNKGVPLRGPVVYTNSPPTAFSYNAGLEWTTTNATSCFGTTLEGANVYAYPIVFNGAPNPGQNWPYTYISTMGGYFLFDQAQPTSYTPWTTGNHHWRSFLNIPQVASPATRPWLRYGTFRLTCTGPTGLVRSKQILIDTRPPTMPTASCTLPVPADPGSGICASGVGIPKATTWTWPAITGALSYNFRIEDSSNAIVITNRVITAAAACTPTLCSVSFPLNAGGTYHSVVSVNAGDGSCAVNPAPQNSPPFTLAVCTSIVTSTIQTDTSNSAIIVGGACSAAGATAYSLGGAVTATKIPSPPGIVYTGPVDASGTYAIGGVPYSVTPTGYNLTFIPPAGYYVTCPVGGTYSNVTVPTVPTLPFFVSPVAERWFQTIGADVAALSSGTRPVNDPIPVAACAGTGCDPVLSVQKVSGNSQTSGLLLVNGSAPQCKLSSAGGAPNNVSSPTSRFASVPSAPVLKEGYEYFYRLFSIGVPPISDDFAVPTNAQKPIGSPAGGKSAFYHNGNLTVDTPWSVLAGEKIVVFVNGNLTINKNITMSTNNAFVGFIVKGNIVITANVGTATMPFASQKTGQVQGMYFADGTLTVDTAGVAGTDMKFVGEGTFAARSGISLLRDFKNGGNGAENNAGPATLFIYRPDLLRNAPDQMKAPTYIWKEVNP